MGYKFECDVCKQKYTKSEFQQKQATGDTVSVDAGVDHMDDFDVPQCCDEPLSQIGDE